MNELLAGVAVIAVLGGITLLGLVVALRPKWSEDKPYVDQDGNEVPARTGWTGLEAER